MGQWEFLVLRLANPSYHIRYGNSNLLWVKGHKCEPIILKLIKIKLFDNENISQRKTKIRSFLLQEFPVSHSIQYSHRRAGMRRLRQETHVQLFPTVLNKSKLTPRKGQIFLLLWKLGNFFSDQCISIGVPDIISWIQIFPASGFPIINFLPIECPKMNLASLWEIELTWSQKNNDFVFTPSDLSPIQKRNSHPDLPSQNLNLKISALS